MRILIAAAAVLIIALVCITYMRHEALRCEGKPDGPRIGHSMILEGC